MCDKRIIVCARKRPLSKKEIRQKQKDVVGIFGKMRVVIVNEPKSAVDLTKFTHQHHFQFDHVFGAAATNETVYDETVSQLAALALEGGIGTCFAFGQTGAGKTHTMFGSVNNPGLALLGGHELLKTISGARLKVSFFEIYNTQLYDLLNKRNKVYAREDATHRVCISGLTETVVDSLDDLWKAVDLGNTARRRGKSGINPDSSRSHAVLKLEVVTTGRGGGRLVFIDLAGSERACDANFYDKRQTKYEGAEINQSLLALKECIRALDKDNPHAPFRQSKLTQVLKDCFVGDSQMCMISVIAPGHLMLDSTLNTLRYAAMVRMLDTGKLRQRRERPLPATPAPCLDKVTQYGQVTPPQTKSPAVTTPESPPVERSWTDEQKLCQLSHSLQINSNMSDDDSDSAIGIKTEPVAMVSKLESVVARQRANRESRMEKIATKVTTTKATTKVTAKVVSKGVTQTKKTKVRNGRPVRPVTCLPTQSPRHSKSSTYVVKDSVQNSQWPSDKITARRLPVVVDNMHQNETTVYHIVPPEVKVKTSERDGPQTKSNGRHYLDDLLDSMQQITDNLHSEGCGDLDLTSSSDLGLPSVTSTPPSDEDQRSAASTLADIDSLHSSPRTTLVDDNTVASLISNCKAQLQLLYDLQSGICEDAQAVGKLRNLADVYHKSLHNTF